MEEEEERSLDYATRRATMRRGRENRVAPLGMTNRKSRAANHETRVTSHASPCGQAEDGRHKSGNEPKRKAPPTGSGPLQGGESGEFGVGDGFMLEEDLEAFAHAFGEDEGF